MKCSSTLVRVLILMVASLVTSQAQTYVWTGIGNGWLNQTPPVNNGTAIISLGDSLFQDIPLTGNLSLNSISISQGDTFTFTSASPVQLTINGGANLIDFARLRFSANVGVVLAGTPTLEANGGTYVVSGQITGSPTSVLLSNSNLATGGAFIFNNTGAGNTYTGNTTLYLPNAGTNLTVAFWNSSPFGTGTVNFNSGGTGGTFGLTAHGTQTVANNLIVNTSNLIFLRSWDAPLTYSGSVTMTTNVALNPQSSIASQDAPNNEGSFPVPGSIKRNPIIFTGNFTETGGARSLTVGSAGILILKPTTGSNTYTGGTTVNGSLIFGNNNAIPTGSSNVLVNLNAYVGFGDTSTGNFATQLAHINVTSSGAVGVDTLPGNSTITYADPINLSAFTNANIRIGTATSAILTGTITPQSLSNYQFGNGGGTLYVQSNLANLTTLTNLILTNGPNSGAVSPLKLFLQGVLTYTGNTTVNSGMLIFDGLSLPSAGQFTAAGTSSTVGSSYLGMSSRVIDTYSNFFSKFNKANTWGILGLDTLPGNSTVTISENLNLTGFNDGVFLGTATSAILTGTITPTTITNANNAANAYRFTAGNGGHLTVQSALTGSNSVIIGSPSGSYGYSDGIVTLHPATANTYTGGTTINGQNPITLEVGGTTPLGTGSLTFNVANGFSNVVGLQADTTNYTLANNIVFPTPGVGENRAQLYLRGSNDFTLSGIVSGLGDINLINPTNLNITLAGNNAAWTGDLSIINGTITLANNNAAGVGEISFSGPAANLTFTGAATAPVIYGITGDFGSIVVPGSTNLTFNVSNNNLPNPDNTREVDTQFGGVISGAGALTVTGTQPLTKHIALYLTGANTYTAGTTITGDAFFALGNNSAAGTGAVTLNAPNGGIVLNSGITFSNALNFTTGTLGGMGTFNPSNLSSFTFGTGQTVSPGLPLMANPTAGTLTLGMNTTFANGGTMVWTLQDPTNSLEGFSQLSVQGNLTLSATTGGFTLKLISVDLNGDPNAVPMTWGQSYSYTILTTTGTITGFDPTAFTFDLNGFQNGALNPSYFSVASTGSSLVLNFQAVPEPSTYALLGFGLVGLLVRRRRLA